MTTKLVIDCTIKGNQYQQTINDLIDLDRFVATHQALEYSFVHPEYMAFFKLCSRLISEPYCEFDVGTEISSRRYEVKTLQTLLFCLSDNIDKKGISLFFQIGNSLFEVKVTGLTPEW